MWGCVGLGGMQGFQKWKKCIPRIQGKLTHELAIRVLLQLGHDSVDHVVHVLVEVLVDGDLPARIVVRVRDKVYIDLARHRPTSGVVGPVCRRGVRWRTILRAVAMGIAPRINRRRGLVPAGASHDVFRVLKALGGGRKERQRGGGECGESHHHEFVQPAIFSFQKERGRERSPI